MFALKLILMVAVVNLTTAWITPERCQESSGSQSGRMEPITAQVITSFDEIIKVGESLNKNTDELYKDFKLYHVPTEGSYDEKTGHITVNSTNNCTFETYLFFPDYEYKYCGTNDKCTLRSKVRGTEYYFTATGHMWGANASNKSSFITIGGEASTDNRYSCYHNKNRTTKRTVECSTIDSAGKKLYLYEILTKMGCDIGTIDLEPALRNNKTYETAPENYFSKSEIDELLAAASITYLVDGLKKFHMNIDKISRGLFDKLMTIFPYYDFSTDTISIKGNIVDVNYYQAKSFKSSNYYKESIPFTNENGNGIYKYACGLK